MSTLFDEQPIESDFVRGRRVAIVGKLGGVNRKQIGRLVTDCGGTMVDSSALNEAAVDLIVIGADELPIADHSELFEDQILQKAAEGILEIIGESRFWEMLGLVDTADDVKSLYTPAMLAQLAGVPVSTVRRWQRRGLISAVRQVYKLPYFDYQEVVSARRLANLIASGASPKSIEDKLSRLTEFGQEIGRPISQLSVLVEGRNVLLRRDGGLIEPSGQKRIDFDALESSEEEPESNPAIRLEDTQVALEQLTSPDQFLALAIELEDQGENDQAVEVYRSMLLAFGPNAETCFQLAELLYFSHQYEAARERYFMAIELDETFVEARANLGCVLLELGQVELAINAFQGALKHHPDYPDVHFHLARTLDQLQRFDDAEKHWQIFLNLAPQSPWAEEAKQRLSRNST